jgi:hypothetical protein
MSVSENMVGGRSDTPARVIESRHDIAVSNQRILEGTIINTGGWKGESHVLYLFILNSSIADDLEHLRANGGRDTLAHCDSL